MKKLFIAAVVLVSMSLQAVAGPIITIRIHIGKTSQGCDGFSFCRDGSGVNVDWLIVPNGTEGGTTLQLNETTGNLDITIPASIWKEKANYFSSSAVVFDEQINFGPKISSALRSTSPVGINTGKYLIKKDALTGNVILSVPQTSQAVMSK